MSLKQVHGRPKMVRIGPQTELKPKLDHSTLFRILVHTNASGNKTLRIARILNQSGVKVEKNFQQALFEKSHTLDDFFEHKVVEFDVYHQQDFQLFKMTDDKNLVDKMDFLPFKNKEFILPKVGVPGQIEDTTTGQILRVKKNSNEIFFLKKKSIKTKKSNTRSSKSKPHESNSSHSDQNMWIVYHADSFGYFRIKHIKSGKFLTSTKPNCATIADLIKVEKYKGKRHLVKVKKTYAWCPNVEALITFIADQRGYADQDLHIEFGLDAGQGSLKMLLSIQAIIDSHEEKKEPEV